MKYYKVCWMENGKFYSAVIGRHSQYRLEYMIGKTTKPKVGAIFAFKSLEMARRFNNAFLKRMGHIFECEGTPSKEQPPFILRRINDERIERFWKEELWIKDKYNLSVSFHDTAYLKSVKLIREIK